MRPRRHGSRWQEVVSLTWCRFLHGHSCEIAAWEEPMSDNDTTDRFLIASVIDGKVIRHSEIANDLEELKDLMPWTSDVRESHPRRSILRRFMRISGAVATVLFLGKSSTRLTVAAPGCGNCGKCFELWYCGTYQGCPHVQRINYPCYNAHGSCYSPDGHTPCSFGECLPGNC
jgi:hypothetical protein